ncbi:hypothetical protein BATDEDRAFT_23799 [Batrachochytrium dendrobatidis JAM81]|uniref:CYRIA/CYRIB Rac1 binding domain-containing protein n=2 Tax=Batrachochytrium dendrobatidis TaxID=109871 RepID=F4P086_BATDJ|nr:uncharacterized protein BATDEDRAFT_23799 [Batrachochytrium dendrobatidis JAM81]EGF81405.1 hypothetical protein BATDEDRAFT_23799 [Batrachochytrium dendrobatidis JAM81]KAJ8329925.1 hypothetical protein O5D80_002111 [Batrachochytrium dendrobatidis]KAK5669990.1 hypothetical protein QVD99_004360 [Batrachochytrium dendrobatidis]OAJ38563.1 hypothetical protein BDEG_22471 [Batrachochytrium dendrobatidis JEL423]|eukprot:XP_006677838.1 hypothetical protein BATDEDRAFT_23799 [Batrachochytrium dendrobatidis JAM81]
MGAIISIFKGGAKEEEPIDIPIDFNAQPTPEEQQIYNSASEILSFAPNILQDLRNYTGCGEAIRQAISTPGRATEDAAWAVVCPAVVKLKEFYDFSSSIEQLVPRIWQFFGKGDVSASFEKYQATARRLAEILDFATQFDGLKMSNPNVQNDFSYYRRSVSRMKMNNAQLVAVVSDDLANKMSLFFAHSSPVTKALIDATALTISSRAISQDAASDILSTLAGIAYSTVAKNRAGNDTGFYLRVMVISIVLYDHVDLAGAFIKTSKISIKSSVKVIQTYGGSACDTLLNSLRYSTRHLNDETTPKVTKQLLAV